MQASKRFFFWMWTLPLYSLATALNFKYLVYTVYIFICTIRHSQMSHWTMNQS